MSAERSQGEYLEELGWYSAQAAKAIDVGINKLAPSASHSQAAKLFDGRAAWCTVRDWRVGRRGVPRWALDLISSKLMAHGAEYLSAARLAQSARASPGHTGAAGKIALNRYRAAQALKKQKPGG